jgi:putative heme-binding domain-containing protein
MLRTAFLALAALSYPFVGSVIAADPKPGEPSPELVAAFRQAQWVWLNDEGGGPVADQVAVRRSFTVEGDVKRAEVLASCDNRLELFVNGHAVARSDNWQAPVRKDVTDRIAKGENVIAILGDNEGGAAGLIAAVAIETADGKKTTFATGGEGWVASTKPTGKWNTGKFDAKGWKGPNALAAYGGGPWKDVLAGKPSGVAPADAVFETLPGFEVERLFTVPKDEMGSWVNITFDQRGRLIASDQGDKGLYRITPPAIGSKDEAKVEKLNVKMTAAQGLLYAFGSLYVAVNGGQGSGLYRLRDTDGDDQYDEVLKLKDFQGGGEHGPHGIALSPDGKSIYCTGGNHTKPPFEVKLNAEVQTMGGVRAEPLRATLPEWASSTLPANWDEDVLLPRQWDANGHATGILAPGGWIAETDPDGKTWKMFSVGYRNQYDMAFNADGELFAYDSDMEWDMGTPWYRPTTVTHATSGSEFGWRSGTARWPPYYVDSLPQLIDVGPGSPVGVTFGYGAKFPAKYQKALYICDWTFGTMYAIHIEPEGASYKAVKEEFVARTPLPLTDAVVGPDGALYFTVGGRGTQSELFRVRYTGKESTAPVDAKDAAGAELRALRRKIETYHKPIADGPIAGASSADGGRAVEFLVPHLAHADRHIRYAARVALEFLPVALWQEKVLGSADADTVILGAVALAHQAEKSAQPKILEALGKLKMDELDERRQIDKLRAYQLALIRLGEPAEADRAKIVAELDPRFPAAGPAGDSSSANADAINKELVNLLVYLKSPTVVAKTLVELQKPARHEAPEMAKLLERNRGYGGAIASMIANHPDLMQIHYAFALRNVKEGWTAAQRAAYFSWFDTARTWSGGASFQGFLRNIDRDAYATATPAEQAAIDFARKPVVPQQLPKPKGPPHPWTLEEIVELTKDGLKGRNYDRGKTAFAAARCVVCHRFAGEGGATGPDLTQLAGRFSAKDIAEATVNPNKVISDQYKAHVIETSQGQSYTGRIVSDVDGVLTVVINPEDSTKTVRVKKSDIESMQPSAVSLMPADLLKPLGQEELLDLMAFILSRGDNRNQMFRK